MKRNNLGMSIVEIVVVLAMIGILATGGVYGLSQLLGFSAREGADTIAESLAQTRVYTMAKAKKNGNVAWELAVKSDGVYVRTVVNADSTGAYKDEKKVCDAGNVKVSYGVAASSGTYTYHEQQVGDVKRLYFNRSTGALSSSTGSVEANNIRFKVTRGNKTYYVDVISKTGKVLTTSRKK